jgi:hypothetical protein
MNLAEYAREPIYEDSICQLKEQLKSLQDAFWLEYQNTQVWMARAEKAEKKLKELTDSK